MSDSQLPSSPTLRDTTLSTGVVLERRADRGVLAVGVVVGVVVALSCSVVWLSRGWRPLDDMLAPALVTPMVTVLVTLAAVLVSVVCLYLYQFVKAWFCGGDTLPDVAGVGGWVLYPWAMRAWSVSRVAGVDRVWASETKRWGRPWRTVFRCGRSQRWAGGHMDEAGLWPAAPPVLDWLAQRHRAATKLACALDGTEVVVVVDGPRVRDKAAWVRTMLELCEALDAGASAMGEQNAQVSTMPPHLSAAVVQEAFRPWPAMVEPSLEKPGPGKGGHQHAEPVPRELGEEVDSDLPPQTQGVLAGLLGAAVSVSVLLALPTRVAGAFACALLVFAVRAGLEHSVRKHIRVRVLAALKPLWARRAHVQRVIEGRAVGCGVTFPVFRSKSSSRWSLGAQLTLGGLSPQPLWPMARFPTLERRVQALVPEAEVAVVANGGMGAVLIERAPWPSPHIRGVACRAAYDALVEWQRACALGAGGDDAPLVLSRSPQQPGTVGVASGLCSPRAPWIRRARVSSVPIGAVDPDAFQTAGPAPTFLLPPSTRWGYRHAVGRSEIEELPVLLVSEKRRWLRESRMAVRVCVGRKSPQAQPRGTYRVHATASVTLGSSLRSARDVLVGSCAEEVLVVIWGGHHSTLQLQELANAALRLVEQRDELREQAAREEPEFRTTGRKGQALTYLSRLPTPQTLASLAQGPWVALPRPEPDGLSKEPP